MTIGLLMLVNPATAAERLAIGQRGGLFCDTKKDFDAELKNFLAKRPIIPGENCMPLETDDTVVADDQTFLEDGIVSGKGATLASVGYYALHPKLPGLGTASLQNIVLSPRRFIGRTLRFSKVACISDPKAGFTCVQGVGGRVFRLDASFLGAKSPLSVAEKLLQDCTGSFNLERPDCIFDIEFEPTSGYVETVSTPRGDIPVAILISPGIEMWIPKTKR